MKTKVTMKDAVVTEEQFVHDFDAAYWAVFCEGCRYKPETNYWMRNLMAPTELNRCNDCKPRVLPPTRWRNEWHPSV